MQPELGLCWEKDVVVASDGCGGCGGMQAGCAFGHWHGMVSPPRVQGPHLSCATLIPMQGGRRAVTWCEEGCFQKFVEKRMQRLIYFWCQKEKKAFSFEFINLRAGGMRREEKRHTENRVLIGWLTQCLEVAGARDGCWALHPALPCRCRTQGRAFSCCLPQTLDTNLGSPLLLTLCGEREGDGDTERSLICWVAPQTHTARAGPC